MRNSEQLSLYFAEQLPTLLIEHPSFKFIGLKVNKESTEIAVHAIYIEKEDIPGEQPFRALITINEWNDKSVREEFFLDALTAERLIEKLQKFDAGGTFVFFKVPRSVAMNTINMCPQEMFCKLFPELGIFKANFLASECIELERKSIDLLAGLVTRLKAS